MTSLIIFDIDGTLANNKQREHLLPQNGGNWDDFFQACDKDASLFHMQFLVKALNNAWPKPLIVFATGRPERVREKTVVWLESHYDLSISKRILFMRQNDDHRPDDIIKQEILEEIRHLYGNPLMVFDDRNQVVKMWRDNGVPCLQVADGDF